jgi:hypothetical protein
MGSHNGDSTVSFFVNGLMLCEKLHLATLPGERWVPWVCMGNDKVRIRMLNPSEALWDLPEQQGSKNAETTFKKAKVPFDDAGWLGRRRGMGGYARSWYMIGTEELLFSPNPNLHLSIWEARDLEGMDLSGLSDPYVTIRVGEEKWFSATDKKKDPRWIVEQTKIVHENLDPIFNEKESSDISEVDYAVSSPFVEVCFLCHPFY